MALEILKSNVDGLTAYVSMEVVVYELDEYGRPGRQLKETVGIDHDVLIRLYHQGSDAPTKESMNAAVEKWLSVYHAEAIARNRAHVATAGVIGGMKGQKLFLKSAAVAPATAATAPPAPEMDGVE